jgi:hypothetical protein
MTVAVQVAGKSQIMIAADNNFTSLIQLGWTRDRCDIAHEGYWLDVPGDERGGESGPPVEIQFLGEIARVRLELSKWDLTQRDIVRSRVRGATVGQPAATGTLMFAGTNYIRLLINPAVQDPINFPIAIPRGVIEQNRGSKWSLLVCEFECHMNSSGVLYNTATS